jgi:hypothetical protein
MDEYTMALCLFLFGTACVAIGWAIGRVEAKQEYKTRLMDAHYQICDLLGDIDKAHDLYHESIAEMGLDNSKALTFEQIYGSRQYSLEQIHDSRQ